MAAKARNFQREAGERICTGLNVPASTVRVTLGPKGRTGMAEPSFGPPPAISSRDIVAWRIELEDRFANPGVRMARDVGSRTSQATGGETATATVLEQAIVDEGAPTEP